MMTAPGSDHPFTVVRDGDPGLNACRGAVVAIGNFDGVHRGHRAVIAAALERAKPPRNGRPRCSPSSRIPEASSGRTSRCSG